MCLFKNMIMRKPEKPSLQKAMVTDEESNKLGLTSGQNNYSYVMDGGALLHRLCWLRGSNFKKIAKSYVQYVWMHYGKCYIVFDGYESASTKSVVQKQRRKRFQKCQDVDVKEDIIVPFTQIKILSNTNNKGQLIKMLSQYLKDDENKVINCSGDADSTICHTALNLATTGKMEVVLHGYFCHAYLSLEVWNEKYILPTKNAQRLEYCILIPKARQGKRSHSFCSRDDRMWHNISTLWKEEEKLFEPNFEIKDVTVFVNDDARYMGRTEWGWRGCSQMLCRDVHFWEKWWNSNFSLVGHSLFFKIIQYLLSIYL